MLPTLIRDEYAPNSHCVLVFWDMVPLMSEGVPGGMETLGRRILDNRATPRPTLWENILSTYLPLQLMMFRFGPSAKPLCQIVVVARAFSYHEQNTIRELAPWRAPTIKIGTGDERGKNTRQSSFDPTTEGEETLNQNGTLKHMHDLGRGACAP